MSTKIRVGIIGQGRSGRNIHSEALKNMPDRYTIVAVSDELEERRALAVKDYGCDAYATYRDMMQRTDLDLIVNATPSHLHVPVSLELLEAGFHVLCEKPLARKAEEVDRLIAAAGKAGKVLAVFQQARFRPVFREIRRVIESGVLGRLVQITVSAHGFGRRWDWQTLKSHNGGALLNAGAHYLDQSLQLFGTETMPNVLCRMDSAHRFGDAEDYCKLLLSGEDKPVIDIEISSCHAYPDPIYSIQGTTGGLKATKGRVDWRYFKPEETPHHELELKPIMGPDGKPQYCKEELTWYEESWEAKADTAYPAMQFVFYENLYDTLTQGKPLIVTPEQVRQQVAVMEECFRQNPKFSPES